MSEFKFACPVCGQHITADSGNSGAHIDCPTCFRRIVVPQAPTGGDSRLILSAAQAERKRGSALGSDLGPLRRRGRASLVGTAALLMVLCAAGSVLYFFREDVRKLTGLQRRAVPELVTNEVVVTDSADQAHRASPAENKWTTDLTKAVIPPAVAAGRLHGSEFVCERAALLGGTLSLRQGKDWPPDLGVVVLLQAKNEEDLSGKTLLIAPGRQSEVPQIVLHWKDGQHQAHKQEVTAGYALKLVFEEPAAGRLAGKIYLALPDKDKSVIAGAFDAEIKPAIAK